ncbi:hypothetical protein C1N51_27200 (plasmid) [Vibrio campbellii]|nr:hypothetical protein C1N51_27200 [Vibrio campbellii]
MKKKILAAVMTLMPAMAFSSTINDELNGKSFMIYKPDTNQCVGFKMNYLGDVNILGNNHN